MTDDEHRAAKCGTKVRYLSADSALINARLLQRRAHKSVLFGVYVCPYCAAWHVGKGRRKAPR